MKQSIQDKIKIGNRLFEIVSFNSKLTNKSVTQNGIGLAQGYLALVPGFRIYNTKSGEPIIRGRFNTLEEGLRFALWMEKSYSEWFQIWDSYPGANLPSWLKYTVSDGAKLYEIIEYLNTLETISYKDVAKADYIAREKAKKWVY